MIDTETTKKCNAILLTGLALDWAAAKAKKYEVTIGKTDEGNSLIVLINVDGVWRKFSPSTDVALAWSLMQEKGIHMRFSENTLPQQKYEACDEEDFFAPCYGSTPFEAGLRVFVWPDDGKDHIDIPEILCADYNAPVTTELLKTGQLPEDSRAALPTLKNDGTCTHCGHETMILAVDQTCYTPVTLDPAKGYQAMTSEAKTQMIDSDNAVRLFCDRCGTHHQVPESVTPKG